MTHTEALKLALELAEDTRRWGAAPEAKKAIQTITAIKEALAQPQQEPVATLWQHGRTGRTRITMPGDITDCDANWFPAADLYAAPPQRTWQGLTDDERDQIWYTVGNADSHGDVDGWSGRDVMDAIEAKLKAKNEH